MGTSERLTLDTRLLPSCPPMKITQFCVGIVFLVASLSTSANTIPLGEIGDGFSGQINGINRNTEFVEFTLAEGSPQYSVTFAGSNPASNNNPIQIGIETGSGVQDIVATPFTVVLPPSNDAYSFQFRQFTSSEIVTVSVAAVPLPAAAWLFMSAIGAVVGLKRINARGAAPLAAPV